MTSRPFPLRPRFPPLPARGFALLGCWWLLGASALGAQQIGGRTLEGSGSTGVAGVTLELAAGKKIVASTTSDSAGRFSLTAPRGGTYQLRAARIGYSETLVAKLEILEAETIDIEIMMAISAVPLEPLRVVTRARTPSRYLNSVGFYEREKHGIGSFLTRYDIEKRGGGRMSDVLRSTNGVRLVRDRMGRRSDVRLRNPRCTPSIYLDGAIARLGGPVRLTDMPLDDLVLADDVDGVEIYHGPSETPPEFNRDAQCGIIVIWTRRRL